MAIPLNIGIEQLRKEACGATTPTTYEGNVKTSKRPCEETLFIL